MSENLKSDIQALKLEAGHYRTIIDYIESVADQDAVEVVGMILRKEFTKAREAAIRVDEAWSWLEHFTCEMLNATCEDDL